MKEALTYYTNYYRKSSFNKNSFVFVYYPKRKQQKHQASADVPLIVRIAADGWFFFRFFVWFDESFPVASVKRTTSFCSSICRRINFKPARLNPTLS